MDTKKWLKMVEHEAKTKTNGGWVSLEDGTTLDIEMSQKIGDQWFFGFANSNLEELIPNFCMDSALYSIANDCLVRLMLDVGDREMLEELLEQSIQTAKEIEEKNNKT